MRYVEKLEYGQFYHIYNRGINGHQLFKDEHDYTRFLNAYDKYVSLIADTYAWVLLGNHFHFLIRVKNEDEILAFLPIDGDERGSKTTKKPKPATQLGHLFNTYAQYFNKKYKRTGSLFEHPFKRKQIIELNNFQRVVLYIHNNPVKHGFVSHPLEYAWSSYLSFLSNKRTKIQRDCVLDMFGGINSLSCQQNSFKYRHADENFMIE